MVERRILRPFSPKSAQATATIKDRRKSDKKNKKKKNIIKPYLSRNRINPSQRVGMSEIKTCDPSSGGIGTKLKTAKRTLAHTTKTAKLAMAGGKAIKRISREKVKAKIIFPTGPAIPTKAGPYLGYRKL